MALPCVRHQYRCASAPPCAHGGAASQDDAGARVVRLCLDARSHGTESLAFAEAAPFQGPALLCFNDATFTDADFASISRIGDSVKRDQAGKTGRFGCDTLLPCNWAAEHR